MSSAIFHLIVHKSSFIIDAFPLPWLSSCVNVNYLHLCNLRVYSITLKRMCSISHATLSVLNSVLIVYVFLVRFNSNCVKRNLSKLWAVRWAYYVLGAIFHVNLRVLQGILCTLQVSFLMHSLSHAFLVVLKSKFCTSTVEDWMFYRSCFCRCLKLNFLYAATLKPICSISHASLCALTSVFCLPAVD